MKSPFAGISLALALALLGCQKQTASAPPPPMPPPTVTVAAVETQELVEWNEFTGRTEAMETVEIRPRISGYIQEIRFQAGQLVKKGDVLFTIDPRWHQADYDRAVAAGEQAKARWQNMEREAARSAPLLASKAISMEESESRQARLLEAKAAWQVAEAARDTARLDLELTQIHSPIDGRVSRALLTAGNYVSGGAGASTVLTTVVSTSPIYVYADVDENSLLKFNALQREKKLTQNRAGQIAVELELADETGFPRQGYIESFDNRVSAQTGTILLRTVFPNDNGQMVPGLFARLRVPASDRRPTLLVDEKAIGTDQAQKFVFTLTSSNTAAYRPVVLGPIVQGKRVVRSGLEAGEKIVVNGLQRIRPGMPVTPETSPVAQTEKPRQTN